jgi:outer membrane lipoprotein SlyB
MKRSLFVVLFASANIALAAPITNDDVIRMVQSGAGESLIMQTIDSSEPVFDTSVDGVIRLKQFGVTDNVIQKMMSMRSAQPPQGTYAAPASPPPAGANYAAPAGGGGGGSGYLPASAANPRGPQYGPPVAAICRECGVIEYMREVQRAGQTTGAGAAVGGVTGGLLGAGIAGRRDRGVGAIVGAVGGAVVGNEIERNSNTARYWEVGVRHDDGIVRAYPTDRPHVWRTGDRVRVINGYVEPM